MRSWTALVIGTLVLLAPATERAARRGIVGAPAPTLSVNHWYNLPPGRKSIDVSDYRGKVVYLFFFQSWCPGCHSHGFPTLKLVRRHFSQEAPGEVVFMAVQTVFEGFWINSKSKAASTLDEFDLDIPVAHDAGPLDEGSKTMRRYRSGGTPWTVIIDKQGVVRFNGFRIKPTDAIGFVEYLRQQVG